MVVMVIEVVEVVIFEKAAISVKQNCPLLFFPTKYLNLQ